MPETGIKPSFTLEELRKEINKDLILHIDKNNHPILLTKKRIDFEKLAIDEAINGLKPYLFNKILTQETSITEAFKQMKVGSKAIESFFDVTMPEEKIVNLINRFISKNCQNKNVALLEKYSKFISKNISRDEVDNLLRVKNKKLYFCDNDLEKVNDVQSQYENQLKKRRNINFNNVEIFQTYHEFRSNLDKINVNNVNSDKVNNAQMEILQTANGKNNLQEEQSKRSTCITFLREYYNRIFNNRVEPSNKVTTPQGLRS
jgi:hypothetical protein